MTNMTFTGTTLPLGCIISVLICVVVHYSVSISDKKFVKNILICFLPPFKKYRTFSHSSDVPFAQKCWLGKKDLHVKCCIYRK